MARNKLKLNTERRPGSSSPPTGSSVSANKSGLQELLADEIRDLYDAEKQLVSALPRLAVAASDQDLKEAFRQHLEVTKGHVERLEHVFELLAEDVIPTPCKGMRGLIEEAEEAVREAREAVSQDWALVTAAQRVEHYEMAAYSTARELARTLGMAEAAQLLHETLLEEVANDGRLAEIVGQYRRESESGGDAVRSRSDVKTSLRDRAREEVEIEIKPLVKTVREEGELPGGINVDEVVIKANDTFRNPENAMVWLHEYCPALQGIPVKVIETPARRGDVLDVLACIDHGMIY